MHVRDGKRVTSTCATAGCGGTLTRTAPAVRITEGSDMGLIVFLLGGALLTAVVYYASMWTVVAIGLLVEWWRK